MLNPPYFPAYCPNAICFVKDVIVRPDPTIPRLMSQVEHAGRQPRFYNSSFRFMPHGYYVRAVVQTVAPKQDHSLSQNCNFYETGLEFVKYRIFAIILIRPPLAEKQKPSRLIKAYRASLRRVWRNR